MRSPTLKKGYKQSVFKMDSGAGTNTEKPQSLMMIQSSQLFKKGGGNLRDSLKSPPSSTPLLALKSPEPEIPFDR